MNEYALPNTQKAYEYLKSKGVHVSHRNMYMYPAKGLMPHYITPGATKRVFDKRQLDSWIAGLPVQKSKFVKIPVFGFNLIIK